MKSEEQHIVARMSEIELAMFHGAGGRVPVDQAGQLQLGLDRMNEERAQRVALETSERVTDQGDVARGRRIRVAARG